MYIIKTHVRVHYLITWPEMYWVSDQVTFLCSIIDDGHVEIRNGNTHLSKLLIANEQVNSI